MGDDNRAPEDKNSQEKSDNLAVHTDAKPNLLAKLGKKNLLIIGAVLLVVIVGAAFAIGQMGGDKDKPKGQYKVGQYGDKSNANQFSTDPVERGKYLSLDNCSGSGSKQLGSGPMRPADIGIIEPYGLVAGGHVTPVDHQYYYAKDQKAAPSTYDVIAPADGTVVNVEVRPRGDNKADYRVVISYSCTFFSYFDLANSLSPEFAAKMPSGYATKNGPQSVKIPVQQGEVLAKVGGQSLDFAVWDITKTLKGLLVPKAYSNKEPWKINTVLPSDYYTAEAKTQLLPFYVRTAEPRDGKLDYDVDGTASGGWFKQGTNGYVGAFKQTEYNNMTYADGHLSLAPDLFDPTSWVFSTGAVNHGTQYGIKAPAIAPDKLTTASGAVKYELVQLEHVDETGTKWLGASVPKSIKLKTDSSTVATALVQLTAKRELKVEIFQGKTPSQVSDFSSPTTYDRGDSATIMGNQ
ncbi:MAG TPA: hypothetical protein VLI54_00120 [Bacillota bacterium]|nr:hypothetical protein [Bacillota bacterium]